MQAVLLLLVWCLSIAIKCNRERIIRQLCGANRCVCVCFRAAFSPSSVKVAAATVSAFSFFFMKTARYYWPINWSHTLSLLCFGKSRQARLLYSMWSSSLSRLCVIDAILIVAVHCGWGCCCCCCISSPGSSSSGRVVVHRSYYKLALLFWLAPFLEIHFSSLFQK